MMSGFPFMPHKVTGLEGNDRDGQFITLDGFLAVADMVKDHAAGSAEAKTDWSQPIRMTAAEAETGWRFVPHVTEIETDSHSDELTVSPPRPMTMRERREAAEYLPHPEDMTLPPEWTMLGIQERAKIFQERNTMLQDQLRDSEELRENQAKLIDRLHDDVGAQILRADRERQARMLDNARYDEISYKHEQEIEQLKRELADWSKESTQLIAWGDNLIAVNEELRSRFDDLFADANAQVMDLRDQHLADVREIVGLRKGVATLNKNDEKLRAELKDAQSRIPTATELERICQSTIDEAGSSKDEEIVRLTQRSKNDSATISVLRQELSRVDHELVLYRKRFNALHIAVREVYYSAHWHPDRHIDGGDLLLWEYLRDAAGFPKGDGPKPISG
jgi:hypothetical protein